MKHFSPDSHIPFYSRIYFDYDLQEANGVEYCTRRDVMQRNIGCRSLYWDEKGTVTRGAKRNWVGSWTQFRKCTLKLTSGQSEIVTTSFQRDLETNWKEKKKSKLIWQRLKCMALEELRFVFCTIHRIQVEHFVLFVQKFWILRNVSFIRQNKLIISIMPSL